MGLFGSKSDHPLASLKSIQQMLDAMPRTDPVVVLDEIGQSIAALIDAENDFKLEHQFAALCLLDEAAHPFLRKITYSYFALVEPAAFQENRWWGALNAYCTFTELAYIHLLQEIRDGSKGSASLKSSIPLICTRGIYAVLGRMECAAVRYMPIEGNLWEHLADFYDLAEMEQYLDEDIQVYPGSISDTSVNRMFASVVIWYSIGVGALKPLDLHITRCLIVHLRKYFLVTDHPAPESLFIFDLAHPLDPARARDEGAMYPPSTRFVAMGVPASYFDGVLKTLAKELVPEEFKFGVAYGASQVAEVVNRVAAYSKVPLPSRRHQRRKLQMKVRVLAGYRNLLDHTGTDLGLSMINGESCMVEDISATGMKYIIPAGKADGVKIGSLVGLQPENATHWGAGIVRRLRRDEQNNLHVGVRIVANRIKGVLLQEKSFGTDDIRNAALMVERQEDAGESWLMVKSDTFSTNRSPTMTDGEFEFLLLPVGVIEKGEDFDLVRYRKMSHEQGSEVAY